MRALMKRTCGVIGALALAACGQGASYPDEPWLGETRLDLVASGGAGGDAQATPGPCQTSFGGLSATVLRQGVAFKGAPYTGTTDATIQAALPNLNANNDLECAADGQDQEGSCLLRFDLSAIPPGATVAGACLELQVNDQSRGTFGASPLSRPWTGSQVTWINAASGSAWQIPGAKGALDRGPETIVTIKPRPTGKYHQNLAPSFVANWIANPSSNHGLIFYYPEIVDGVGFATSEAPIVSDRPALVLFLGNP
jgi:hypothetical protein